MLEYQKIHRKNGFTIIEIILALLIISLVIVGVLMFFPTSRRATEESALKTRIANNVVSEAEVIKAVGYKSLEKLLGTYNSLLVELLVKGGSVKVYFDNVEFQNPSPSLLDTLKVSSWNSSLNELGAGKGVIEIKRVSGVSNLLSVKVRVEYGSGKNYEINTYISL
ncbi:MAG: prepilin-type N-terminal cleavage/methylation domain-containing protein [bacterium]|nr:prepilin-type N-terminal cleavage/methylation domain-containing protein [bacterium]